MLCGGEEAESAVFENAVERFERSTGASSANIDADCV
jgi:hypothetical protein